MNIRVWLTVFLLVSSAAYGQSEQTGAITITSRPPGCTVYLSGEMDLVTTTPVTLRENLRGPYRVVAVRPGYEDWTSTVVFTPGREQDLTIELAPKTRYKAAIRSLVIPGWGQYYAGEKTRSFLWGLAALSSGIVALTYESRYRDRKDDWENGLERFDRAVTVAEKERLRTEVLSLQDQAYDAESDRRRAWGIVAGVWVVNFIDALVFFPEEKRFANMPLTVRPTPDGVGSMVTLNISF